MEAVWEIIAPYVAMLGGAAGSGTVIYIIIRLLLDKITRKNIATLKTMFDPNTLSQSFADKMSGRTLNIDVTALTEQALKKLSKQLDEKITSIEMSTNSYKHLLALMGKALSKLKALSKEEVTELASAINDLESEYVQPEIKETMTVVLQPIELISTKEDEVPVALGVNFDGLGGQ